MLVGIPTLGDAFYGSEELVTRALDEAYEHDCFVRVRAEQSDGGARIDRYNALAAEHNEIWSLLYGERQCCGTCGAFIARAFGPLPIEECPNPACIESSAPPF